MALAMSLRPNFATCQTGNWPKIQQNALFGNTDENSSREIARCYVYCILCSTMRGGLSWKTLGSDKPVSPGCGHFLPRVRRENSTKGVRADAAAI
jgi:hypothetical protein